MESTTDGLHGIAGGIAGITPSSVRSDPTSSRATFWRATTSRRSGRSIAAASGMKASKPSASLFARVAR